MMRSPMCECGHRMFDHSHYELEDDSPFHRICLCMMCVDCNGFKEKEGICVANNTESNGQYLLDNPTNTFPNVERD